MKELDTTNLMRPVELAERDAEAVAGGVTLTVGRPGGCPGCTSGGYFDPRAPFAQVINPAE
jgi:hypothetical protein